MENNLQNIGDLFCDIFKGYVGSNPISLIDMETQDNILRPKSIGGIELKNYQDGEYKGLEEYQNE